MPLAIASAKQLYQKIQSCSKCPLHALKMNILDVDTGRGKLLPFYQNSYKHKAMLVGLNPSFRRFPGIRYAFGARTRHNGTGQDFIDLLKELDLLNRVYITNLIKCSHPTNVPAKINYDMCFSLFLGELKFINPLKIIALGRKVQNYLIENLPIQYLNKLKFIQHPVYWSAYKKISREEYSAKLIDLI